MNETALIKITTPAEIEEHLLSLKEYWEQKVHDARSMACTEDTVQAVKKMRADMRKECDEVESQRKAAKAAYMAPWDRVEAIYRDCVKIPYIRAKEAYDIKIAEVEDAQKAECEKMCREYFAELCAVHHVEWLRYEQSGVRITLTEAKKQTPSKLFDALSEFVVRVAQDVDAMSIFPWSAEIIAEYKHNGLNRAKAEKTVHERREAEEREREAAEEHAERKHHEAEAVAKVEVAAPLAPPVEVKADGDDPVFRRFQFVCIDVRKSQLIKVREFMKSEGIKYEQN